MESKALFIGACVVPYQSSNFINTNSFKDFVVDPIFKGFRESLENKLIGNLDPDLYKPIHFYTFGHFHIFSICLVDDFYFSNFGYSPNSKYISRTTIPPHSFHEDQLKEIQTSHFEYQVTNGFNVNLFSQSIGSFEPLSKSNFLGVCRLKLNSLILLENKEYSLVSEVAKEISRYGVSKYGLNIIVSESFSWHELTLLAFGNSLSPIMDFINDLRCEEMKSIFVTSDDNALSRAVQQNIEVIVDTHTTYGLNPELFKTDSEAFKAYSESNEDNALEVTSKIHVDPQSDIDIISFFRKDLGDLILHDQIKMVDGRSDYIVKYEKKALINYLKVWEKLIQLRTLPNKDVLGYIRKFHSNISKPFLKHKSNVRKFDLEPNAIQNDIKFLADDIRIIEQNLESLHVSKDLTNSVISLFNNYNDIIDDITLFQYFIDTRSHLLGLQYLINRLAIEDSEYIRKERITKYRSVNNLTMYLREYIRLWQLAYDNRFQQSKRFGYNSDYKVEFNGGAHQIIHCYDSLYKLSVAKVKLSESVLDARVVPIATFGGSNQGIEGSRLNLHLNYFQLFYPETFLYALFKESINHQFDRHWLDGPFSFGVGGRQIYIHKEIDLIRKDLSALLYDEPDVEWRALLFEFCPPREIKYAVDYMISYTSFFKMLSEDQSSLLIFWYWHQFLQSSEHYNIDGTLNYSIFKRNYFAFIYAVRFNSGMKISEDSKWLSEIVNCDVFKYYIDTPIFKGMSLYTCVIKAMDQIRESNAGERLNVVCDAVLEIIDKIEEEKVIDDGDLRTTTIDYLKWLKRKILPEDGTLCNTLYQRDKYGHSINDENSNYSKGVSDPHGGIFIRDAQLRLLVLKERIQVFEKLRNIGLNYKANALTTRI
ncbi:MAG TPA: hypothetical protein VFG10_17705 [Saprospiraceae bacterium]|nr:hypothetical protein [Saprospiraceae bacterium]